jgi:hypothetical protein
MDSDLVHVEEGQVNKPLAIHYIVEFKPNKSSIQTCFDKGLPTQNIKLRIDFVRIG